MKMLFFLFSLFCESIFLNAAVKVVDDKAINAKALTNVKSEFSSSSSPSLVSDVAQKKKSDNRKVKKKKDDGLEQNGEEFVAELSEKEIGYRGNWVKKREWLKEAYKVDDQIQVVVDEVEKSRDKFSEAYKKIDDVLDKFYKEQGVSRGKVKKLFLDLNRYLSKKKDDLSAELNSGVVGDDEIKLDLLKREIEERKVNLKQLELDMLSIEDLDKSLSDRLKKLEEQIKIALEVSADSAKKTEKLWQVVDDKIARVTFYDLKENLLAKVTAIKKYITGTFSKDFFKVISVIENQTAKVVQAIDEQEKAGLIIKDRAKRIKEIKISEIDKTQLAEPEKKEVPTKKTWYQKAYEKIINFVAWIVSFFKS